MSTQFGKYTIEKKLGQGGMGAVYLALDPALNRRVALKVITSKDAKLLERFHREASAVAKLNHPNIVQIYEQGIINNQHYFTMDYIEGTPLDKLIQAKPKPSIQSLARIILQVASALHYAHSQKIIHRDIKPANILISMPKDRPDKPLQPKVDPSSGGGGDNQGQAYLADFGLAKELTGLDRSLTLTGTTVGTPNYMPPEQAMGKKDEIDQRSDIYSLGATLYHCITGRAPFSGKEIYEIMSKVINDDPPAPSTITRLIPKDLETICLKCLNKDKAKRYQTAGALAQDMKRYLEGDDISARRTGVISKLRVKAAKNKIASLAIAGAAVVLIAVVIGLTVSSAGKNKAIAQYLAEAQKAFDAKDYDQAREWSAKVLALSPADEKAQTLLKRIEKIIKTAETKKREQEAQAKAAADKAQRTLDLRAEVKAILDRAAGAPTPDQKIKLAQDALALDPAFGDAYQVIGYAYKTKAAKERRPDEYRKLIDKAFEYFTRAINATPTLAYSYYERAMITAYTYNKPEDAITDFNKVLDLDPNSHIGYYAKGTVEYYQKNYDKAIADYTKAIELYPDYDAAYHNRGAAYANINDLDRAIADCNKTIELNPNYALAYFNRGIDYFRKGAFDKAIADYDKIIELDPNYADAYLQRGLNYSKKAEDVSRQGGRHSALYRELTDKAIADCTKAIALNPRLADAYYNRSYAYYKKAEFEQNPNAHRELLERSLKDADKAIELNSKHAEAYNNRGLVYVKKGDTDRAINDHTKAIELDPKNAAFYNNRGNAYINKGALDKGLADFNKTIELDPKLADAYANCGNIYANKAEREAAQGGRNSALYRELVDKAIDNCTKAIELGPETASSWGNRGLAYAAKGDLPRAIADMEMFLKLAPNHPATANVRKTIEQWKKMIGK
ncbi:MAG: tetratricopeptide repeat protein [Planctomycetota bacterium]